LAIVQRNVRQYALLPRALQGTLRDCTRIVAAEREWVGCRGLEVTDEMRVTVAAQASLLLLGNPGYYFERVPSVLLYPTAYRRQQSRGESGIVDEEVGILGESWHRGSIVLAWPVVLEDCLAEPDGSNLVLHEFAHHLDGLDGATEGIPPLPTQAAHDDWERVIGVEYEALLDDLGAGRRTLLDPYAGESKPEFFAVASECFFELPEELRARHAELYRVLANFYCLDPAEWGAAEPEGLP
jgi:Mlc titration factor MtfA (ptsG expression regulator)